MCLSNDYLVLLFTKMFKMCKILLLKPSSGVSLETKFFVPIFVEQNCGITKIITRKQNFCSRNKFCSTEQSFVSWRFFFFFMLVDMR